MNALAALFVRFLLTGATGALLSLLITWGITTFVVGVEHYFSAYLVGIAVNLLFNFVAYTLAVFKTKHDHLRRLTVFLFYGIIMAFLQGATVQLITSIVGVQWYLPVIALVIGALALFNFLVFKLSIFKERASGEEARPREILGFIIVCAVLLRLATLFHVLAEEGVNPLVYGDAYGYRELATNLAEGNGFVSVSDTGEFFPEVFRTPGLPLLLSPFARTDGGFAAYFVLLAILGGVLLPTFTYLLGKRFLSVSAALLAAGLVAFEPHLVFFSILPQTEMPFILAAYGGLAILFAAYERRSLLLAAFSGALIGFSILIKPGFLPVFAVVFLLILFYAVIRRKEYLRIIGISLVLCAAVLVPWFMRTHAVTGVVAISGAGWRNIYTDYLASLRAIENHTEFSVEKKLLKQNAQETGIATDAIDNPASAPALRTYALAEMWEKKALVVKLEATLLASYFLQDGYYYQLRRFLLIPADTDIPHVSPTFLLMQKGVAALPDIVSELSRQYFIPILGRVWTFATLVLAVIGFFLVRHPIRYVFLILIGLSALAATAIGLGVESRLRLPMLPLLYLLAAPACLHLLNMFRWKNAR
ncbi:MAG: glycosyltransferase family 39 protein [Minisyncoccia bacterium]